MNTIYQTLKDLTSVVCVSGAEEAIASVISEKMRAFCDDVSVDTMGNVVCKQFSKGATETLLLVAHMDEIGFVVCDADENGFVLLAPIGGIHAAANAFTRVKFENGVLGNLVPPSETKPEDITATKLVCDIGAKTRAAALRRVKAGDRCATLSPLCRLSSSRITSRALDNKAGCATLIAAAEKLAKETLPYNVVYLFTVQEEVGCRGAAPAAFDLTPDYCINVDVTTANDAYGAKGPVKLGGGAAIKIKDRSVICHRRIIEHLKGCAEEHKIPVQTEILTVGGTDTGAVQASRAGVVSGAISIPLRYVHTDCETADMGDLDAVVNLLVAATKTVIR